MGWHHSLSANARDFGSFVVDRIVSRESQLIAMKYLAKKKPRRYRLYQVDDTFMLIDLSMKRFVKGKNPIIGEVQI